MEAASSFGLFAPVESFLVAKVSIGESLDHCLPKAGFETGSPASRVVDHTLSYHDARCTAKAHPLSPAGWSQAAVLRAFLGEGRG